jgi:hypothetical protein
MSISRTTSHGGLEITLVNGRDDTRMHLKDVSDDRFDEDGRSHGTAVKSQYAVQTAGGTVSDNVPDGVDLY